MTIDARSLTTCSTDDLRARLQALQEELARRESARAPLTAGPPDAADFQRLLDESPHEVYVFCADTMVCLFVNGRARLNLGYAEDDLHTMHIFALMPDVTADNFQALSEPLRAGIVGEVSWSTEHRRKDGSRYPVEIRLSLRSFRQRPAFVMMALDISERPHSDEALRASSRTLQMLIDSAPLPIIFVDGDGRVTGWNPSATTLFGWTAEEVLGRELPYVPAGLEAEADALFAQGLAGQVTGPIRIRRCRKDGRLLDLKLWPTFIHDAEGRLLLAFGLFEDITEQSRAEAALRESEQRYLSLYENNPSMYFTLCPTGTVLSVNRFGAEQLGYRQDELLGASVLTVFDPADHATVLNQLRLCTEYPLQTHTWEIGKVRKDGSRLWVKERARGIADSQGRFTILIVCEDITDRKQAEVVLEESERRLQRFVAEAPIGLVILDNRRRLLNANKAFCELTGYSEKDLIGHTSDRYTHPDDLPGNLALAEAFYRGELSAYELETRYVRKSGDIVWVSIKAVQIDLPNHPGPLLLAVVQDITERRRAAEERERLSQDLHDNILQSLYAVGMQLEAGKLSSGKSQRKSRAYTTQAIDQLNRLVVDVRQYIALLKHRSTPAMDFGQALRHLIASFCAAGQTAPEITINDRVIALITPEQSEHLLNIAREALSNSMRHSGATHRWVRMSHTGAAVRLEIGDDGVGFDPKTQWKRGHGLSHMAARAKRIRARFRMESRPRKGTCVTVDLPVEELA